MNKTDSYKQRKILNEENIAIEIINYDDKQFIRINLIDLRTGEIRQRTASYNTIAKKIFGSSIKTHNKNYPDDKKDMFNLKNNN